MSESKQRFFPTIDIIRGILSILVIYCHTILPGTNGSQFWFLGLYSVIFFFCISGFLLSYLAKNEFEKKGSFNKKNFYWRRILRIWPAYILYLIIIIGLILLTDQLGDHITELSLSFVFLGNLLNALTKIFIHKGTTEYFAVLWSLGIEEQFYLFFPLIITSILAWRWPKNMAVMIVLTILCTALRLVVLRYGTIHLFGNHWPGVFFQTTSYLDVIFISIITGIYRNQIGAYLAKYNLLKNNYLIAALLIGWLIITKRWFSMPTDYSMRYAVYYPFTATLFSFLTILFSYKEPAHNAVVNFSVLIGKLSYGIYLFHMPFYILLYKYGVIPKSSVQTFLVVLIISTVFSYIVYTWFEKYFRELSRRKFSSR